MKLSKRTLGHFLRLVFLGLAVGTLAWELLERIIALGGAEFNLSTGPVGFDAGVVALWFEINPGSPIGALAGWLLFRRV